MEFLELLEKATFLSLFYFGEFQLNDSQFVNIFYFYACFVKNEYLRNFVPHLKKNNGTMKKDIHPDYKEVVFFDTQADFKFMTKSTMNSKEKIKWEDGNEYPLIKIEVSSASHPFYTGKKMFLDTAGRVEKFNKRYKKK